MSNVDNGGEPRHPSVKPANQRGAARLAAVQALYQMDVGGTGVMEVVAEYEAHRLGQEVDGDTYLKADPSWFRSIVSGVVRDQTKIDPLVRSALLEDWPLSRLDATVAPSFAPAPSRFSSAMTCRSPSSSRNMSKSPVLSSNTTSRSW